MKEKQPDANDGLHFWQCPNCGQTHFSDVPPDMCAFCDDFTTWQMLHHVKLQVTAHNGEVRYIQLPLPLIFYDE